MIHENQKNLRQLNLLSDALVFFLSFPVAYWIRFRVLPGGVPAVALPAYLRLALAYAAAQTLLYALWGLYSNHRRLSLGREMRILWTVAAVGIAALMSLLFALHADHYSRLTLGISFALSMAILSAKRLGMRRLLRHRRPSRRVLLLGSGALAARYLRELERSPELGFTCIGYLASRPGKGLSLAYLGSYEALPGALEKYVPDEVVSAIETEEFQRLPQVIAACEKAGSRLSIIPFYAEYMLSRPQFDDLNGIPLLNLRQVPLDNWVNAALKRGVDVAGAAVGLLLTAPLMLVCALVIRLGSPGPALFRQERLGKEKRVFTMFKLRTMLPNDGEDTAWSVRSDPRRTRFGSFLRKYSIDELPQLWNVLRGDMSLVGPRPELPYHVEHFREEIPLYMVKHQVRPGMTGWAQVNGLRGDTSIQDRIEYDIFYIENWTLPFDLKILWVTMFGGKFINDETRSPG